MGFYLSSLEWIRLILTFTVSLVVTDRLLSKVIWNDRHTTLSLSPLAVLSGCFSLGLESVPLQHPFSARQVAVHEFPRGLKSGLATRFSLVSRTSATRGKFEKLPTLSSYSCINNWFLQPWPAKNVFSCILILLHILVVCRCEVLNVMGIPQQT